MSIRANDKLHSTQPNRWQEHFMEVLSTPDPETVAEVVDDSDINE